VSAVNGPLAMTIENEGSAGSGLITEPRDVGEGFIGGTFCSNI